jgi:hypothetical protein
MRHPLILLTVLLVGCTDRNADRTLVGPPQASTQQTAASLFTFVSPLAQPSAVGAVFNPSVATVVEVCHVVGGGCGAVVARFRPTDTGDPALGIVAGDDQHHVNWKLSTSPLAAGELYRINVLTASTTFDDARVFGSIDVGVDAGSARVFDPVTGEVVATYTLSQTLPIKYRTARGILCETLEADTATEPCLETWLDSNGGTFVTETGLAGAYFPPGAIPPEYGRVTLVIEKFESPDGSIACLPITFPQYIGCYVYRLYPHVPEFEQEVLIGICPDPAVIEIQEQLDMWKWDEVDPASARALPRRIVDFLECPGYTPEPAPLPGALSWAHRLIRPLLSAVTPAPVYAATISPFGCGIHDLSRFGWARTLLLSIVEGDGETAVFGAAVSPAPTVRVTANGEKVQGLGIPVSGVPVSFSPGGPDDSAQPTQTVTDAHGTATTEWTLGEVAGAYSLMAIASNPLSAWPNVSGAWGSVVFGATAVEPSSTSYDVGFRAPVVKGSGSGGTVGGLAVRVEICHVVGQSCNLVHALNIGDGTLRLKERFYQGSWSTTDAKLGSYRLHVVVNGTVVSSVLLEGARNPSTTGAEPYQFKPGQNVEVKFGLTLQ